MLKYITPQSLVEHRLDRNNKNYIPSFSLLVGFDRLFAGTGKVKLSGSLDLWSLIGIAASAAEKSFVFDILREDIEFRLLGCFHEERFALFQSDYDVTLSFLNAPKLPPDPGADDLLGIRDWRWELAYFMPKAVLMPFEEMVWVGEKALQHGDIGNVTRFRQEGDAVMAVYQGMLQRGEVPY